MLPKSLRDAIRLLGNRNNRSIDANIEVVIGSSIIECKQHKSERNMLDGWHETDVITWKLNGRRVSKKMLIEKFGEPA